MASLAESYQFAMKSKNHQNEPMLIKLGSRADSHSASVSSWASMARQFSGLDNEKIETSAGGFATAPGRSSSTALDFSSTLPAAAVVGCDTPRLSTSQHDHAAHEQRMQQHLTHAQRQQHCSGHAINNSKLYISGSASIRASQDPMQGVALDTMHQGVEPVQSAATAAADSRMEFVASSSYGYLGWSPLSQQQDAFTVAAAAYAQDDNLQQQQQHLHSISDAQINQHLVDPAASLLLPVSGPNKSRRASCCAVPDSHYHQQLLQLQQLMKAEQQMKAELINVQEQHLLSRQQQLQCLQLQHAQQQQQQLAHGRQRRASYSVASSAEYMSLQPPQGFTDVGQLTSLLSDEDSSQRSAMNMHRPSLDMHRQARGIRPARASLDLPTGRSSLDNHSISWMHHQHAFAAPNCARKPRRASCCIIPDSQQQLQHLQHLLHMQEQQLAQEQQLQARLMQAQQLQRHRERRASCCVLPSAYAQPQHKGLSYGYGESALQQMSSFSPDASTLATASAYGVSSIAMVDPMQQRSRRCIPNLQQGSMPPVRCTYGSSFTAAGAAQGIHSTSPRELEMNAVPFAVAAIHGTGKGPMADGRATTHDAFAVAPAAVPPFQSYGPSPADFAAAAAAAADKGFQAFSDLPLSHAGSGCSSHSSRGTCASLAAELGVMRSLSCDTQMEETIAGMVAEAAAEQQLALPHLNSSSCSSKQSANQQAHNMQIFRQTSMSSYASDDTMEAVASGGAGLTSPSGQPDTSAASPGLTHPTSGVTAPGAVQLPNTSTIQHLAASDVLGMSPTASQGSVQRSLQTLRDELKQLMDLKAKLATAAAAAARGSAAAAACAAAQARSYETLQMALAAKAALEAVTAGGLDSIRETDQDVCMR